MTGEVAGGKTFLYNYISSVNSVLLHLSSQPSAPPLLHVLPKTNMKAREETKCIHS